MMFSFLFGQTILNSCRNLSADFRLSFNLVTEKYIFEFACEQPNDLCMAELPFDCSDIFVPFFKLKTADWQLGWTFQNKNIYIFECQWLNGNSNGNSAVHTRTQIQTEGYRMHLICTKPQLDKNP